MLQDRVRELRTTLGYKLKEMGEKLGISHGAYSDWERGKNNVPESKRQLICKVFNVNREWLDTGNGDMFVAAKSPEDLDKDAFLRVITEYWEALPERHRALVREIIAAIEECESADVEGDDD